MPSIDEEMKARALEAQKFSRKFLVLELDYSPASVDALECQCDALEYALSGGRSPENIARLTRLWGAYLGETLRRLTGAEWIEDASETEQRFGLRGPGGQSVFPHDQVARRLAGKDSGSLLEWFSTSREILQGAGGQ